MDLHKQEEYDKEQAINDGQECGMLTLNFGCGGGVAGSRELLVKPIASMVSAPSTDSFVDQEGDTGAWQDSDHIRSHTLVKAQKSLSPIRS